ncbi:hypothetical protein IJ818_08015 [bacterium]|nr:hypothetical protein [bacterium]
MKIESINNLSENEILELYQNVAENQSDFITGVVWYVRCYNGISGNSPAIWYCNNGYQCYTGRYGYNTGYQATGDVCGYGNPGQECGNC